MLWGHLEERKWVVLWANEMDIDKSARVLFPKKGVKLRKFGYAYPLKPTTGFKN